MKSIFEFIFKREFNINSIFFSVIIALIALLVGISINELTQYSKYSWTTPIPYKLLSDLFAYSIGFVIVYLFYSWISIWNKKFLSKDTLSHPSMIRINRKFYSFFLIITSLIYYFSFKYQVITYQNIPYISSDLELSSFLSPNPFLFCFLCLCILTRFHYFSFFMGAVVYFSSYIKAWTIFSNNYFGSSEQASDFIITNNIFTCFIFFLILFTIYTLIHALYRHLIFDQNISEWNCTSLSPNQMNHIKKLFILFLNVSCVFIGLFLQT